MQLASPVLRVLGLYDAYVRIHEIGLLWRKYMCISTILAERKKRLAGYFFFRSYGQILESLLLLLYVLGVFLVPVR